MATVTFDDRTFFIDGKRTWIVSGTIHYARIPRAQWADRLRAAQDCGLNCVEVPVLWSLHEPHQGHFDFSQRADIAAFIRQIAEMGMHCILRPGPYIGSGYDLGGLPAWVIAACNRKPRTANSEFLQAVMRYFAALMEQLQDLQATRAGGPILLVQNEHEWFCGDDDAAAAYLGELNRFLREAGVRVPIIARNNLFVSVDGEVDVWAGAESLLPNMRQLRLIHPDCPRLVAGYQPHAPAVWGEKQTEPRPIDTIIKDLAGILVTGAQFNVDPFCAGTNLDFLAGRLATSHDAFAITDSDPAAPLRQDGVRSADYQHLRRLCTFASSFPRIFANLEPDYQPITADPGSESGGIVVTHARGEQGSVVFLFPRPGSRKHDVDLVLEDGTLLKVPVGYQPATWILTQTHLLGKKVLDYTNLCAFSLVGHTLVLYGHSGADAVVSINGTPFHCTVPKGKKPLIETHEEITLVIANEQCIDTIWHSGRHLIHGAAGRNAEGKPLPHPDHSAVSRITPEGLVSIDAAEAPARRRAPVLSDWSVASTDEYVLGTSDRFALTSGPTTMEKLGVNSGYGWLRIRWMSGKTKKTRTGAFESADRLHVYQDQSLIELFGVGPGAHDGPFDLSIRKGKNELIVLVDNLGRLSQGTHLGESKGLWGHLYELKSMRAPALKLEDASPIDPFIQHTPVMGLHAGDLTDRRRLTWSFMHRRKNPIFMCFDRYIAYGVVLLNDEPVHTLAPGIADRLIFTPEQLRQGGNVIQIAVVGDAEALATDYRSAVKFYEGVDTITSNAEWAFAKWEQPPASTFEPIAKSQLNSRSAANHKGSPSWWRAGFDLNAPADAPLYFDATGLSKGQLFINGHNVGRYFVNTHRNKAVPPQTSYYLPEPFLRASGPNELVIFDEHGFAPGKTKLTYA